MLKRIQASKTYAIGLRQLLRDTIDPEEARKRISDSLAGHEAAFLSTLERGVYANPRSPYLRLLQHAGIAQPDVREMVAGEGIEGALGQLYDAGVYITADEIKARSPIRRGSLEFQVNEADFDNPLAEAAFEGRTSGSSGRPTRAFTGFDLMQHEAPYYACLFDAHGVSGHPLALWHAALQTTLKTLFKHARCGRTPEVWWTSSRFDWTAEAWKREYLIGLTLLLSRIFRRPLPRPRYLARGDIQTVTRWLATKAQQGTPGVLETNPSTAVRICLAAREQDLPLSGTAFHLVGEPLTSAKDEVISAAGARAIDRYANVELGVIALACSKADSYDDLHLASDKVAVIEREQELPSLGGSVRSMLLTTLVSSTPKLWLNVQNGDYATVEQRGCGCPFGELGFNTHLSGIRAFDKITSEGLTIPLSDLLELVENVLPTRFGGGPTDYQLFEEEEDGVPKVSLAVRPSVGDLDEAQVVAAVIEVLKRTSGVVQRADEWQSAGTFRIVRRDPIETPSAKILPMHVLRAASR